MATVVHGSRSTSDTNLEFMTELGRGKAAVVHLVRDVSSEKKYAEKIFKTKRSFSSLFRDVIYSICFQAPFPYGSKESATKAAMYRRKALRYLTEFWFGIPQVADVIYTRWDEQTGSYVLGTEYIEGRGPRPGQFDPRLFRNLVLKYSSLLLKAVTRRDIKRASSQDWEIDEAAAVLDELKDRFHRAGFIGSEWQVDKSLSIPTSNLRKDENGRWILIDAESGMPALASFRYLWPSIKMGKVPLFDDVDFVKLHKYLEENEVDFIAALGETRFLDLAYNVQQLEYYTRMWKSSEPAVFRHRSRIVTDSQLRSRIKRETVENWHRTGRISAERAQTLLRSNLLFSVYLGFYVLTGLFSGLITVVQSIAGMVLNALLGVVTAVRLVFGAFFHEEYLRNMAVSYVDVEVDSWHKSGRLTDAEAYEIRRDMESPEVMEYLKGFTIHVVLKLADPPFVGNFFIVWLAIYYELPQLLGTVFISSALRTIYTCYRALRNWGKGISYRNALLIGMLPQVGVLAYSMQMASVQPRLSRFLALRQAAKFGSKVPLFGGMDSRIEHLCMKVADVGASLQYELADFMEQLMSHLTKRRERSSARETAGVSAGTEEISTCQQPGGLV
ncbi:MAG: hypothetical protein JSW38_00715 [Dehalococcoidia bacterium]|nr:MAG: hypothetical protein JSW38_00715 [Dehalococcoidia bacterium]